MTRRLLTFDDLDIGYMDPLDYGGVTWTGGRKHPYVTESEVISGSRFGMRAKDAPFDVLAADIMPSWQNYTDFTLVLRGKQADGERLKTKAIFVPEDAVTGIPLLIDLSGMTDLVRFNIKGRADPDRTGELPSISTIWVDNIDLDFHDATARGTDWAL